MADENVVPAEAQVTREDGVINYYFPVEIEVVGALDDEQMDTIADHVFRAMADELGSRA